MFTTLTWIKIMCPPHPKDGDSRDEGEGDDAVRVTVAQNEAKRMEEDLEEVIAKADGENNDAVFRRKVKVQAPIWNCAVKFKA